MKLVLKEEVYNVGLPGDVVEVADGYGRNYLIPAGIAIPATKGALKQAEALTRARKAEEAETRDDARELAERIESRTLTIPKRMDEGGHLYGSVGRDDVHRVLKERGHQVDERKIELKGRLKEIGVYEIPVQVHPQVTATATIEIVDVEGRVTREGEQVTVEVEVDEDQVSEAAAAAVEASGESVTSAEVLAEQALQAARQYEEQQKARGGPSPEPAEPAEPPSAEPLTSEEEGGADDESDESDEADQAGSIAES